MPPPAAATLSPDGPAPPRPDARLHRAPTPGSTVPRRSCDRGELPFAAHLFQAFQSCVFLLESLDAVGTAADVGAKIERFLIQPRIERCVVERYRAAAAGDKTPPWRAMLASAGFVPVQASSFAEAQAESLLKKVPVRGFRVEKRAGSLVLHWQRGELVSVSAWRC